MKKSIRTNKLKFLLWPICKDGTLQPQVPFAEGHGRCCGHMVLSEWGFRPNSAGKGYTGLGTTWDNEMNFVMNNAPGAGSIAPPVDQQSSQYTTTVLRQCSIWYEIAARKKKETNQSGAKSSCQKITL